MKCGTTTTGFFLASLSPVYEESVYMHRSLYLFLPCPRCRNAFTVTAGLVTSEGGLPAFFNGIF